MWRSLQAASPEDGPAAHNSNAAAAAGPMHQPAASVAAASPTLARHLAGGGNDTLRTGTLRGRRGLFDLAKLSSFGSNGNIGAPVGSLMEKTGTTAARPMSTQAPHAGANAPDADDLGELDIDTWVEDGYSSSTLLYLTVEYRGVNFSSMPLDEMDTVEAGIAQILEKIQAAAPHLLLQLSAPHGTIDRRASYGIQPTTSSLSTTSTGSAIAGGDAETATPRDNSPSLYHLAKVDPRSPGVLTWVANSDGIASLKLRDNDLLRLIHEDDLFAITLSIPAINQHHGFEYTFDVAVRDIINNLKTLYNLPPQNKYGLFWQNRGLWLDDARSLVSYVFSGRESVVELRELTEAFLLRVYIPEAETRFTIRALPSFRALDAMRMITYQMANRGIALEPRRSIGQYGFYISSQQQWLSEEAMLASYAGVIRTEDLHFKLQYRLVRIQVRTHDHPRSLNVLVDEKCTVAQLQQLLTADAGAFDMNAFRLHTPTGETAASHAALETTLVWDIVREAGEPLLIFRAHPRPLSVAPLAQRESALLKFAVDYTAPVGTVLPTFARAFGIRQTHQLSAKLEMNGVLRDIDLSRSLNEHRCTAAATLLVQDAALGTSRTGSSLASQEDVNIWDEPLDGTLQYETKVIPGAPPLNDAQAVGSLGNIAASVSIAQASTLGAQGTPALSNIAALDASVSAAPPSSASIASGTLNRLVAHLASDSADGSVEYHDFVKTFLLTYQSFTTGHTLLRKLIERYHVPREPEMSLEQFDQYRLHIQLRVCNVLMQWIKKYSSDFSGLRGVGLCAELFHFLDEILVYDHPFMTKKLRRLLSKHSEQQQQLQMQLGGAASTVSASGVAESPRLGSAAHSVSYNTSSILASSGAANMLASPQQPLNTPASGGTCPAPKLPKNDSERHNIMAYPAEEIARQLTLCEFRMFTAIRPQEFLGQAWSKADALNLAPNLLVLTRRFNAIASWVASVILDGKTPQLRAMRMQKFISVASYLYGLNNFSTLMAIIAGINNSSIRRLRHTHKELPTKAARRLKELELVMNAEASYKQYRQTLHAASSPLVPYIGVVLMDLTFMEDGNPNLVENRINFAKRSLVADVIRTVEQHQVSGSYQLVWLDDFQAQLAKIPDHTDTREKELYALSLKQEPRDSGPAAPASVASPPSSAASASPSANRSAAGSSP